MSPKRTPSTSSVVTTSLPKSTINGKSLSDVLNQPASRKRTLESVEGPAISSQGPALKKQASDTSIGKSLSTPNSPSKIKIPVHPNSGVSKVSSPDKNDKLSRMMKLHLSKTELTMQMTAAKNSNSQKSSSQPSTPNGVQNRQNQVTKTNVSTPSTSTLSIPSTTSVIPAVSSASTINSVVPPASTVKTNTTAKRTGFPGGVNKARSLSISSQSSAKASPPAVTKVVSAQEGLSVSAAPKEPKPTVPQSSSGTVQTSLQTSQNSAVKSQLNTPVPAKQTPAPGGSPSISRTQPSQAKSGVKGVQPATGAGAKSGAVPTTQNTSNNTPISPSAISKKTTPSTATKSPALTSSGSPSMSKTATHPKPSAAPNSSTNVIQSTPVNGFPKSADKEQIKLPATSNNDKALAEQNLPAATPNPLPPSTATKQSESSPSHIKNPATVTVQTSQSEEQTTEHCALPKTGQKIRIRLSPERSTPPKDSEPTQYPVTSTSPRTGVATRNNNSNNTTPTTARQTGPSDTSPALSDLSSASSPFETDENFCDDGGANTFTSMSLFPALLNFFFIGPAEEFLAHENAIQAAHSRRRDQRFLDFISTLQQENIILQRCVKEENARHDELKSRCIQAELVNRNLEIKIAGLNQQCQQTLSQLNKEKELREETESKLSTAERNAETNSVEAKQRLADALQIHEKDLEEAKKAYEDSEKKLREELEVCKREKERVLAVFRTVTSIANASELT
jgi:hypothetical protein